MERILITGATGFLGGAVARAMQHEGLQVIASGRDVKLGAALQNEGIEFSRCDLADDPASVRHLITGCTAVVHSAALSAPWGRRAEFIAANVTATRNVVNACIEAGVRRLVHISSPSVLFDFKDQRGLAESAPWTSQPVNDYIDTKRLAERIVSDAQMLNAIILRPKALFGPGDTTLLPRVIRVARRGRFPLIGDGDPLMDLTFIDDAVNAVRLALRATEACRGKVYHITSGDPQPRSAVLGTMLEACGIPARFRSIPLQRVMKIASLMEFVSRTLTRCHWEPPITRYSAAALSYEQTLDISAARADLGYTPTTNALAALCSTGQQWRATNTLS